MKWITTVFIVISLVACTNGEVDKLHQDNAQLKTQVLNLTTERDALKLQIESIKTALTQTPRNLNAPTASDAQSTTSLQPDTTKVVTPTLIGPNAIPVSPTSSDQVNPSVLAYAQEVIKVAIAYGSTGSTPPIDCIKGYEAGSSKLALSEDLSLTKCELIMENGQFKVNLEQTNGIKATVESNGP